jgi:hypothetical protein
VWERTRAADQPTTWDDAAGVPSLPIGDPGPDGA